MLELLFHQKEDHHTPGQRFQFLRAARLAQLSGLPYAQTVVRMLGEHIKWTTEEQESLDTIVIDDYILDDMTEKPSPAEVNSEGFWKRIRENDVEDFKRWLGDPDTDENCEGGVMQGDGRVAGKG